MNYAHFAEYVRKIEDDLIHRFGVSPESALRIVTRLELDSIKDYTETKDRNQLIIEYKELGPKVIAERMGVSPNTARKKFNDAIAQNSPSYLRSA